MFDIQVKVDFDLSRLRAFMKDVKGGRDVIEAAWLEIATLYRAEMLKRFRKFSRGEGDWPELSPGTIKAKGSEGILIDTGLLLASMNPAYMGGEPVNFTKDRLGVTISFSALNHVSTQGSSGVSIADIATFHQLGLGVPQREILVEPDKPLMKRISQVMVKRMGIWWKTYGKFKH